MSNIATGLIVAVAMSAVAVSAGCSGHVNTMAVNGKNREAIQGGSQGELKFCYSCAAPLHVPHLRGPRENYCKHCTDDKGNLKSRQAVQKVIAEWFKSWQPGLNDRKALVRAAEFMKAMPAWAGQFER